MKKYFIGTLAFMLAFTLCALQSFTSTKVTATGSKLETFNWYPVSISSQITSTTPIYTNKTKAEVILLDACKDQVLPNCLYGTNETVTLGQNIATQPASQRITQHN